MVTRKYLLLFMLGFFVGKLSFSHDNKQKIDSLLTLQYSDYVNDLEYSKQIFEEAINFVEAKNDESSLGKLYHKLGIIYHLLNDAELSTDYFNKAILLFEKNDDLQNAGNSYAELGHTMKRRDIEKSKRYFRKGIKLLEQYKSPELYSAYDNYGVLQHIIGNVDSAAFYFQKVLAARRNANDSLGIVYSLQKTAVVFSDLDEVKQAIEALDEALEISRAFNDSMLICETLTYFGDIYNADNQYAKAIKYYDEALIISRKLNLNYLVKHIYSALPDLYSKAGRNTKAFETLKQFSALKDSLLNEERVRSIAELETKFESTQKEQKIKLLEQDAEIKALNFKQNRRINLSIIGFLLLLMTLLGLLVNRQKLKHKTAILKQKERLQKERLKSIIVGEEKERERVARELHDGLGQLLSAAKMHVSSLEEDVDDELKSYLQNSIKLVDEACVEVREISHGLLPKKLDEGGLLAAINELKESINTTGNLDFELKVNGDFSSVNGQKAVAIYRIIQELVNNTIKHSNANTIKLSIVNNSGKYNINYADNGTTFSKEMIHTGSGIGWQNIESRVELINGEIKIDSINGAFNANIIF